MYKQEDFFWLKDRRKNIYSQFGEDGILDAIFERIGTENKWCCECGAADGTFFSNTRHLIEQGWSSLQIEADAAQYEKLVDLYRDQKGVQCWKRLVDTDKQTFDRILGEARAPIDLDLLVIDVDGQDYWLLNSLVKHKPRVVMIEYDPNAPADFVPMQDCGKLQAGLQAIIKLGIGKYYWPVAITSTNVIFVRQELCHALVSTPENAQWSSRPVSRHQAYKDETVCCKCGKPMDDSNECVVGGLPESNSPTEPDKPAPRVAVVMSTPRIGFLSTMDCVIQSTRGLGLSWFRGEGAFWSQTLSRGISRAIEAGHEFIVTIDYDTVFEHAQTDNAIAKLVCLLYDNPDVDVIVAAQMKREGGPLLATTDQEIRLLDPLVPITQGHFGLTIFRSSVFERLPKPWFYEKANDDGDWEENRIDADIGFWKNCEAAKINVQMSLDVLVGHLELLVTWPGQNLQPVYQTVSDWREHGKPFEAFDRQRVIAAVKANPALLYGPKLAMGG